MSDTTPATKDRAVVQSLTALLLGPVEHSPASPASPALLSTLNRAHTRALKLHLGPSAVRQTLEQLEDLRGREQRRRDRRAERDEKGKGRVELSRRDRPGWVAALPGRWPGDSEADGGEKDADRAEYARVRRRVLALETKLKHKQEQLAEYKSLAALAGTLDEGAVGANTLADSQSHLSRSLLETADLLPRVNRQLSQAESEFVAAKRRKLAANGRRGAGAPLKQLKLEAQPAGAALLEML